MKFTKDERLKIGKEIYTHQLSVDQAASKYSINRYTARDYLRMYKGEISLSKVKDNTTAYKKAAKGKYAYLNDMDKEQLILEVVKARAELENAKKEMKKSQAALSRIHKLTKD